MKNEIARNNSGDDWKTPDAFYNELCEVFHFDFDPCPYQATFNGLEIEWGGGKLHQSTLFKKTKRSFCSEGP